MREMWIGFLLLLPGFGRVGLAGEVPNSSAGVSRKADVSPQRVRSPSGKTPFRREDGASASREGAGVAAGEELSLRNVVVSSGPCPGRTEAEAREEAAAKADRKMADALRELARERAGTRLSHREAWMEWSWLLRQPGVKQDVKRCCVAKEYGPVATQEIGLSLPHDVLTDWTARLKQQAMLRWQTRLLGGIGTILLTGAALLAIVLLDRRTSGYHRVLVVSSVLLGLGLLVAAVWVWLLWVF